MDTINDVPSNVAIDSNSISTDTSKPTDTSSEPSAPVSDGVAAPVSSDEFKLETPKDSDEEIPEWGKKDPTAFMQYKLGKNNKKHAYEISEIKRKMDEQHQLIERLKTLTQPQQPQYEQEAIAPQDGQSQALFDPITNTYLPPQHPQYGAVLREQQKAYFERSQMDAMRNAEQQKLLQDETDKFIDRMQEAKTRFSDYDEVVNSVQITPTILETAKLLPNGTDLLYYLAKNPKEVTRLVGLPDYLQAKEMIKHSMNVGIKKASNAPAPSKPLDSAETESKPKLANMTGAQMSQYRRDQLKAKYNRR